MVSNVENRTQLKITFLDVLDYSEYSDTNISKKFFFTKTYSFLNEEAKMIFLNRRRYETQSFEKYDFFINFFMNLFL